MYTLKYIPFILPLILMTACNTTKEPKVEERNETQSKINAPLPVGTMSLNQILVKQALEAYLSDLSNFNIDAVVEKTYPKLFQAIDRNLFKRYLSSMMQSTDIQIQSYKCNIVEVSKISTLSDGTEFAQAQYLSNIKILLLNNNLYDNEEKMNFLYDAFKHKYGKGNVEIDVLNRIIKIKKLEKILVIKENNSEWKFLSDNTKYRQLYPNFLPYEILEAIDKK